MENAVLILLLALLVGAILIFLIRAKKRGETCIGCPYAKNCSRNCQKK